MNEIRCLRLINEAIETIELDLTGLSVLTEAATGYYMLTPIIAALANAENVYALTRDSRYGSAKEVTSLTTELAERWGIAGQIEIFTGRDDERIGHADIITNLGFVRPLDKILLTKLKSTAAVPLMWETWEFRENELDLATCRELGIPVLGTDEQVADLQIFRYIGQTALKLLFSLELEVFRSSVVLAGCGAFGLEVYNTLTNAGATVTWLNTENKGVLASDAAADALTGADVLLFVDYLNPRCLLGQQGELTVANLKKINPGISVAHICGGVDRHSLIRAGINCSPERFAAPGYMSLTTDYVGPKPLIDLHTAGLKVGEALARARIDGKSALEAELSVLASLPLAQGFANYHPHVQQSVSQ